VKRNVVITLVLCLLLLGGAFVVYQRTFDDGKGQVTDQNGHRNNGHTQGNGHNNGTTAPDDKGVGKTPTTADAGVAKVAKTDAPPAAADAGTAPKAFSAEVINVRGRVETRTKDGPWGKVAAGQTLGEDDAIRTGRSGEANLAMGDGVKVRLSPRSEFNIQELKDGLSQIELSEGHVTASVDPDGKQVLKVAAKGSDAVVQSSGGDFGVVTDGRGQVAVATAKGSVRFTSRGKTVEVPAGTQSTVQKNGAGPTAPKQIPRSLLLKASPAQVKTNRSSTVVEGRTTPGSLVRVAGVLTQVDAKGRFKRRVSLKEGVNRVKVDVVTPTGERRQKALPPVLVDRKKPTIDASMKWGEGG